MILNPSTDKPELTEQDAKELVESRFRGYAAPVNDVPNCITRDYSKEPIQVIGWAGVYNFYALKREEMEAEREQQVMYVNSFGFDYSDRVFSNESTDKL